MRVLDRLEAARQAALAPGSAVYELVERRGHERPYVIRDSAGRQVFTFGLGDGRFALAVLRRLNGEAPAGRVRELREGRPNTLTRGGRDDA